MWRPEDGHALARRTVYVYGDWKMLNHFGSQEHSYCDWDLRACMYQKGIAGVSLRVSLWDWRDLGKKE